MAVLPLRLLLLNLYHQDREQKVAPYRDALASAAVLAGVTTELVLAVPETPGLDFAAADGVVLTGSHRMISVGDYDPAFAARVATCPVPLLGICYGHQLLARACGAAVVKDRRRHDGTETIGSLAESSLLVGLPMEFSMSESHEEVVADDAALRRAFVLLAVNRDGGVEAIAHRERLLFGVQFHPERSEAPGLRLLANFLALAAARIFRRPDPVS